MYKKLEDLDLEKVQAADSGTEAECICACKKVQKNDDTPQPEAIDAANQLSVHFDLNG